MRFGSPVVQELRPKERAVLLQCIALKMLTDFTLMYTATVGVILRRDAESLSYKGGSPRARTPAARRDSSKQTGALFRCARSLMPPYSHALHAAKETLPCLCLRMLAVDFNSRNNSKYIPPHLT